VVRFTPTFAGSQRATLAIGSDDQARSGGQGRSRRLERPGGGVAGRVLPVQSFLGVMPNRSAFVRISAVFSPASPFPAPRKPSPAATGSYHDGPSNVFARISPRVFTGSLNVVTNGKLPIQCGFDDGAMLKVNGQMVLDLNAPGTYRTASGADPTGRPPSHRTGLLPARRSGGIGLHGYGTGTNEPDHDTTVTTIELRVADGFVAFRVCRRGWLPHGTDLHRWR